MSKDDIFSSPFLTIAVIFILITCLIFLTRIIFAVLMHFARKRYLKLKKLNPFKKKKTKPDYLKEEEERLRHIPKAHSATRAANLARIKAQENESYENESYDLISSEEQEKDRESMNEVKIVDTIKPVGFWSSMILGQKLSYLVKSAQIINKRGRQGFWVSMIEAQEQAAGRQHSRGR